MNLRVMRVSIALWWGSLTTLFGVVPMLFIHLPTPALAGGMAARLFSAQTYVSLACGLVLLLGLSVAGKEASENAATQSERRVCAVLVALALLAVVGVEWGAAPHIVARDNLKFWHALGTGLFSAQWLCCTALLWRLSGQR